MARPPSNVFTLRAETHENSLRYGSLVEDEVARSKPRVTISRTERREHPQSGNLRTVVPNIDDEAVRAQLPGFLQVDTSTRSVWHNDRPYDVHDSMLDKVSSPKFKSSVMKQTGHVSMDSMAIHDPRFQHLSPATSPDVGPGSYDAHALSGTGSPEPWALEQSHRTLPLHKDPSRASVAMLAPARDETTTHMAMEKRSLGVPTYWLPPDYASWTQRGVHVPHGPREIAAERWGATLREPRPPPEELSQSLEDPQMDMRSAPATCAAYAQDRNTPSYRAAFGSNQPRTVARHAHRKHDTRMHHVKSYDRLLATSADIGPGSFNTDLPRFRSAHVAFREAPGYIAQGMSILPEERQQALAQRRQAQARQRRLEEARRNGDEAAILAGLTDDVNAAIDAVVGLGGAGAGGGSPRRRGSMRSQGSSRRRSFASSRSPSPTRRSTTSLGHAASAWGGSEPGGGARGAASMPASPLGKFRPRAVLPPDVLETLMLPLLSPQCHSPDLPELPSPGGRGAAEWEEELRVDEDDEEEDDEEEERFPAPAAGGARRSSPFDNNYEPPEQQQSPAAAAGGRRSPHPDSAAPAAAADAGTGVGAVDEEEPAPASLNQAHAVLLGELLQPIPSPPAQLHTAILPPSPHRAKARPPAALLAAGGRGALSPTGRRGGKAGRARGPHPAAAAAAAGMSPEEAEREEERRAQEEAEAEADEVAMLLEHDWAMHQLMVESAYVHTEELRSPATRAGLSAPTSPLHFAPHASTALQSQATLDTVASSSATQATAAAAGGVAGPGGVVLIAHLPSVRFFPMDAGEVKLPFGKYPSLHVPSFGHIGSFHASHSFRTGGDSGVLPSPSFHAGLPRGPSFAALARTPSLAALNSTSPAALRSPSMMRGGALAGFGDSILPGSPLKLKVNTRLPGDDGILFLERNIKHKDLIKRQLQAVADLRQARADVARTG